jgi:hypothetical protein
MSTAALPGNDTAIQKIHTVQNILPVSAQSLMSTAALPDNDTAIPTDRLETLTMSPLACSNLV